MSDAAKTRGYLNLAETASAEGNREATREAQLYALIYAIRELTAAVAEIHGILDERTPVPRGQR